jgi:hypothetical protein
VIVRTAGQPKASGRSRLPLPMRSQKLAIAIFVGLLGLGTYLWQLSVPIYLQLYDSGVFLASSVHLVSGIAPYRDFVFVQPPGIILLLSPVAIISRVFGTHDGFVVARVFGAIVTALDASLLSWLVRHRGRAAMIVGGAGLALTPVAVFFSSGARLEPFCLCFVLLGSIMTFARDSSTRPQTRRSLYASGALFGVAAAIEFWAFFPFLAMVICLVPRHRRRALTFVAGAASGLLVPCLPFLFLAPKNFVSQVFIDQSRHPRVGGGILHRLVEMTGLAGTPVAPTGWEAAAAFAVLLLVAALSFRGPMSSEIVDRFVVLAATFSVCGLVAAPTAYADSGYFAAPFLLGLLGISVARIGPQAGRLMRGLAPSAVTRRIASSVTVTTAIVLIIGLILFVTTFYSIDQAPAGVSSDAVATISKGIPAGSCVIYDTVGLGLLANRFMSSDPRCPTVIDPYGLAMTWGYEQSAPAPAYVTEWKSYLRAAQFLVVGEPISASPTVTRVSRYSGVIAWNQGLRDWFNQQYRLVTCRSVCIYRRVS